MARLELDIWSGLGAGLQNFAQALQAQKEREWREQLALAQLQRYYDIERMKEAAQLEQLRQKQALAEESIQKTVDAAKRAFSWQGPTNQAAQITDWVEAIARNPDVRHAIQMYGPTSYSPGYATSPFGMIPGSLGPWAPSTKPGGAFTNLGGIPLPNLPIGGMLQPVPETKVVSEGSTLFEIPAPTVPGGQGQGERKARPLASVPAREGGGNWRLYNIDGQPVLLNTRTGETPPVSLPEGGLGRREAEENAKLYKEATDTQIKAAFNNALGAWINDHPNERALALTPETTEMYKARLRATPEFKKYLQRELSQINAAREEQGWGPLNVNHLLGIEPPPRKSKIPKKQQAEGPSSPPRAPKGGQTWEYDPVTGEWELRGTR